MMIQYTTGVAAALKAAQEAQKHEDEVADLFIEMLPESFARAIERRLNTKRYGSYNQAQYQQMSGLGGIFGGAAQAVPPPQNQPYYHTVSYPHTTVVNTSPTVSLGSNNPSTSLIEYVYGLFK